MKSDNQPSYSKISARIEEVLSELLDRLETGGVDTALSDELRDRIDQGLNWYELVPALEDIRDLVSEMDGAEGQIDLLTGLPNARAYASKVQQEWRRWQRYSRPLSLVLCRFDSLRAIVEQFGDEAGQRMIKIFSRALSQRLRKVDFIARMDDDLFVILLPETEQDVAQSLMDKLIQVIEESPFRYHRQPVALTLGTAVVGFRPGEAVVQVYDRALDKLNG